MAKVAPTAISIRLDDESRRHLSALQSAGFSRSEAVREGLRVAVERLRRYEIIRREAELVAGDQLDRQEMLEIAAFMESLRAEG